MKNALPYVRETVESVLAQDYSELELIVVDDGSTDGSGDYIRGVADPRVRLIDGSSRGYPGGRNLGIETARGQIILIGDADDVFPPGRIRAQVEWLAAHPDHGAVMGYMSFIWHDGAPLVTVDRWPESEPINDELCAGVVRGHHCATAYRANALRAIGGYRKWFKTCSDIDLLIRLGEHCPVWYQPVHAYVARLHRTSITRTRSLAQLAWFKQNAIRFGEQRRTLGRDDLMNNAAPVEPAWPPGAPTRDPRRAACELLQGAAWFEWGRGRPLHALTCACRHLRVRPGAFESWKLLGKVLVKSLLEPRGRARGFARPDCGAVQPE